MLIRPNFILYVWIEMSLAVPRNSRDQFSLRIFHPSQKFCGKIVSNLARNFVRMPRGPAKPKRRMPAKRKLFAEYERRAQKAAAGGIEMLTRGRLHSAFY
jgi:ribosomal protein S30